MRSHASFFPRLRETFVLVGAVAALALSPAQVNAGDANSSEPAAGAGCSCSSNAPDAARTRFSALNPPLDVNDEIAALESVQLALSQVADGSTYVWHRSHGRLSGLVRPTASFKDHRGLVCRHVVVVLNGVDLTKKTEAIACRQDGGIWELDG